MRTLILAILAVVIGGVVFAAMRISGGDSEPALDVRWSQLVPPVLAQPPKPLKSFLPPTTSEPDHSSVPNALPEGQWMSQKRRTVGSPASVVEDFNGKRVRIGGYVVPLDFDATKIKEFLLVPFVGACIHVPPPPANQIVYVKAERAFDVKGIFDPVYVTGTLRTEVTATGLAETGYTLEADRVDVRKE